MKYRIIGVIMAVIMLAAVVVLTPMEHEERRNYSRVHQHLTARRDTGCGCDGAQLCSHLPLVVIETGGQTIPGAPTEQRDRFEQRTYTTAADGSTTITVKASVIDSQSANNHPSDAPAFSTDCQFRIRGNSSRRFPKLSYALNFVDDRGENKNYAVMGMDSHHEWVLHGPILDKSLIRNYLWYNIAGEMMDYAPNVRFCELVLDGEYQGLYLMTESITSGKNCRLNLSKNVKKSEGTGYLLRIDRPTEKELGTARDIYTYNERVFNIGQDVAIRYPGLSKLTPELSQHIEQDYSAFEKTLFSYDYDTDDYGYWNLIDTESFVDYFILNEFTSNYDAGNYSTYIYKEVGGKFKLCVWDFNNACDNYQENAGSPEGFFLVRRVWFFMLFRDEAFVEQVLSRYEQLRETYLNEQYLMDYIDSTLEYLGPAIERNNARWAGEISGEVSWEALLPKVRDLHSHEEAVQQLKDWIIRRGAWLDENIHALRQYAHPSRDKVYNH